MQTCVMTCPWRCDNRQSQRGMSLTLQPDVKLGTQAPQLQTSMRKTDRHIDLASGWPKTPLRQKPSRLHSVDVIKQLHAGGDDRQCSKSDRAAKTGQQNADKAARQERESYCKEGCVVLSSWWLPREDAGGGTQGGISACFIPLLLICVFVNDLLRLVRQLIHLSRQLQAGFRQAQSMT